MRVTIPVPVLTNDPACGVSRAGAVIALSIAPAGGLFLLAYRRFNFWRYPGMEIV
jgi:hypothetical protein